MYDYMGKGDALFLLIEFLILPIAGIVGYFAQIPWLLYIAGGLTTLMSIFLLFTGAFRCLGSVLLVISVAIGYYLTESILEGLLLGSCITTFLLVGLFSLFTGIPAIGLFRKDDEQEQ